MLLLFITSSNLAIAQNQQTPTQFDTFINRSSIEWAAYASDTFRCLGHNLNALLRKKFQNGEIKVTMGLNRGLNDGNIPEYQTPEDIMWLMNPYPELMFDSSGNPIPINRDSMKPSERFDSISYNLLFAEQIFFIENGILKSYIPYASPAASIYTNGHTYIGNIKYFSSCFNLQYKYQPGKQNKILFLSQSKKTIQLDSTKQENKLKELYGRNLIETLWPYILKNKYALYLPEGNKKITADELTSDLIEKIAVPVFDAVGNQSFKSVKLPINPEVFITADLQQDWYYDQTRNIVFNKIRELCLYVKKRDNETGVVKTSPVLRIILK